MRACIHVRVCVLECVRESVRVCVLQCVRESVSCDAGTSKKQQHRHNSMDRVRTGP